MTDGTSRLLPAPRARSSGALLRAGLFAALVAAAVVLPGLWLGTLWDNSETAYGEVAREILRTHDSIVMHLNDEPWYIQPPLYFWAAALCAKLFGVTSFAMRLPSAIATVVMNVALALFCARLVGARTARIAALVLATMLMQIVIGRLAIMDAMLDAATTVAILSLARAFLLESTPAERGGAAVTAAIALALGFLTKGLVAFAVPLVVLGPWMLLEGRAGRLSPPGATARGIAIAAAIFIVAPWLIMFALATGGAGPREFFLHYTFGRYTGVIENQRGPWFYYLPVVVLGLFPWTGVWFVALIEKARERGARREASLRGSLSRLALIWTFAIPLFFSFAQTKLPNYVAGMLPGAALLCALWLEEEGARRPRRACAGFAFVPVVACVVLAAMRIFVANNTLGAAFAALAPHGVVFFGAIFLGAVVSIALVLRADTRRRAFAGLGLGTIAGAAYLGLVALPAAEAFKPIPPLAARIRLERRPGDVVALQGVNGLNSLMFYTAPPVRALDSPDAPPSTPASDPNLLLRVAPRVLLVAPTRRPVPDPLYGRRRTALATSGNDTLFLIDGPAASTPSSERAP